MIAAALGVALGKIWIRALRCRPLRASREPLGLEFDEPAPVELERERPS